MKHGHFLLFISDSFIQLIFKVLCPKIFTSTFPADIITIKGEELKCNFSYKMTKSNKLEEMVMNGWATASFYAWPLVKV